MFSVVVEPVVDVFRQISEVVTTQHHDSRCFLIDPLNLLVNLNWVSQFVASCVFPFTKFADEGVDRGKLGAVKKFVFMSNPTVRVDVLLVFF